MENSEYIQEQTNYFEKRDKNFFVHCDYHFDDNTISLTSNNKSISINTYLLKPFLFPFEYRSLDKFGRYPHLFEELTKQIFTWSHSINPSQPDVDDLQSTSYELDPRTIYTSFSKIICDAGLHHTWIDPINKTFFRLDPNSRTKIFYTTFGEKFFIFNDLSMFDRPNLAPFKPNMSSIIDHESNIFIMQPQDILKLSLYDIRVLKYELRINEREGKCFQRVLEDVKENLCGPNEIINIPECETIKLELLNEILPERVKCFYTMSRMYFSPREIPAVLIHLEVFSDGSIRNDPHYPVMKLEVGVVPVLDIHSVNDFAFTYRYLVENKNEKASVRLRRAMKAVESIRKGKLTLDKVCATKIMKSKIKKCVETLDKCKIKNGPLEEFEYPKLKTSFVLNTDHLIEKTEVTKKEEYTPLTLKPGLNPSIVDKELSIFAMPTFNHPSNRKSLFTLDEEGLLTTREFGNYFMTFVGREEDITEEVKNHVSTAANFKKKGKNRSDLWLAEAPQPDITDKQKKIVYNNFIKVEQTTCTKLQSEFEIRVIINQDFMNFYDYIAAQSGYESLICHRHDRMRSLLRKKYKLISNFCKKDQITELEEAYEKTTFVDDLENMENYCHWKRKYLKEKNDMTIRSNFIKSRQNISHLPGDVYKRIESIFFSIYSGKHPNDYMKVHYKAFERFSQKQNDRKTKMYKRAMKCKKSNPNKSKKSKRTEKKIMKNADGAKIKFSEDYYKIISLNIKPGSVSKKYRKIIKSYLTSESFNHEELNYFDPDIAAFLKNMYSEVKPIACSEPSKIEENIEYEGFDIFQT